MQKKQTFSVRVSERTMEYLALLGEELDLSPAGILEQAVREMVERREPGKAVSDLLDGETAVAYLKTCASTGLLLPAKRAERASVEPNQLSIARSRAHSERQMRMRRPPPKMSLLGLLFVALFVVLCVQTWIRSREAGQARASASPQAYHTPTFAEQQAAQKQGKLNPELVKAVETSNVKRARELLEQGANPQINNGYRLPLLIDAVKCADKPTVELLLEKGANIHCAASYGDNPIASAVLIGDVPMAEMLLAHGATIQEAEISMWGAALYGHTEMIQFLLDRGAPVDAYGAPQLAFRRTPLLCAAQAGELDTVRLLVEHGADINLRSSEGETVLTMAIAGERVERVEPETITEMVRLLLTKGARVNDKWTSDPPHSPLGLARERELTEVVKLLVAAGAKE